MNHTFIKIISTLTFLVSLLGILLWYSAITKEQNAEQEKQSAAYNPFKLRALPPKYDER